MTCGISRGKFGHTASAKRERGKISWGSVRPPAGTGQSPVGGREAKPPENFDDLLVKITFLKLNMPFYET